MKFWRSIYLLLSLTLLSDCQKLSSSSKSIAGLDCTSAPAQLRNPETFEKVIELINSLPKPLSLNCFLYNFDPPYEIFAVNNTFSAQPSLGVQSPRIFILRGDFIVSVVPDGTAKDLVEFGKVISSVKSIKGELKFPITENLGPLAAYEKIWSNASAPGQGTECKACHVETHIGNGLYESEIVPPDESHRVSVERIKEESEACLKTDTSFRCQMLKVLMERGTARDVSWPYF